MDCFRLTEKHVVNRHRTDHLSQASLPHLGTTKLMATVRPKSMTICNVWDLVIRVSGPCCFENFFSSSSFFQGQQYPKALARFHRPTRSYNLFVATTRLWYAQAASQPNSGPCGQQQKHCFICCTCWAAAKQMPCSCCMRCII